MNKRVRSILFHRSLNAFPSALMFLKGLCWIIATIMRKDICKFELLWPPFFLKWTLGKKKLPTDHWIRSEIRDPAFYFYSKHLSGYWSWQSKVHIGQSAFVWVKKNLIVKSEASVMWGDAMPYEMNDFIKSFSSTLPKNMRTQAL